MHPWIQLHALSKWLINNEIYYNGSSHSYIVFMFQRLMNAKVPPVLMVDLALTKSMGIIAFVHQAIITPTAKMVWNNDDLQYDPKSVDPFDYG